MLFECGSCNKEADVVILLDDNSIICNRCYDMYNDFVNDHVLKSYINAKEIWGDK